MSIRGQCSRYDTLIGRNATTLQTHIVIRPQPLSLLYKGPWPFPGADTTPPRSTPRSSSRSDGRRGVDGEGRRLEAKKAWCSSAGMQWLAGSMGSRLLKLGPELGCRTGGGAVGKVEDLTERCQQQLPLALAKKRNWE